MHEFDAATQLLTNTILDLLRALAELDPAPLNGTISPSEVAALAHPTITAAGTDPAEVLDLFTSVLAPAVIRADSPRFLAWIPSAPTKASMLFDAVVSLASISGVSWIESAGAVWAENEALRFIADLAGMPESAGGTFVQGGSAANLSALAVARDTGRRRIGDHRRRLQFAITHDTHSSVRNTMHLLDVDPLLVPLVDDRLTGDALASALAACDEPEAVCAVVVNAGSTNAGLVDDLAGVARICDERNLWMHVDAAYGGGALLGRSTRPLFAGIERSDSLVVDPHKWLYAPLDCAALLYRDPALARTVHGQHAAYLDSVNDETGGWNPGDYAYQLTRRARGLPFWFSLAVHGSDAYRDAVEKVMETTRAVTERIRTLPHLELVREPELSIVLFRRIGWDSERYARWSHELSRDQVALVVPTRWHDETVARLAFLHPDTTLDVVDEILASTV
ncbi:MAG TPA: pyridoxal-dependent decarboxylase [Acidimicrobiia bacterium]|nr:pyridoxal-dependent decarboxylase [Acidimicrobiia bacterium]